jgi:hypothetical protein
MENSMPPSMRADLNAGLMARVSDKYSRGSSIKKKKSKKIDDNSGGSALNKDIKTFNK